MAARTDIKKVVILGGGAAGLLIAMKLGPEKKKHGIDVTLVDCKSFFEYTPALISVLYEPTDDQFQKHFKRITADYVTFLSSYGVNFVLGMVDDINEQTVILKDGQVLPYDIAAICTGSFYHDPWKIPCQDNNDDTTSEPHLMQWTNRLDYLKEKRDQYKEAQSILCIGAGPVGVEVATEIACRTPHKQVTLVSATDTVLGGGTLGEGAKRVLDRLDSVRLILGEKAQPVDQEDEQSTSTTFKTSETHQEIHCDLAYTCTGIRPNTQFLEKSHADWLDDKKNIRVDPFFQVERETGDGNIFAIGDVNNIDEPKLFFTAHMQAIHFARNVKNLFKGAAVQPYHGCQISMVVSLGPSHAIGSISGIILNGWPLGLDKGSKLAALAKHMIERISMNDYNTKETANDLIYHMHEKGHLFQKLITAIIRRQSNTSD